MRGVYLVTNRDLCLGRSLETVILEAVRGGVAMVQLREKQASTRSFVEEALAVKKLLTPYRIPLIINDRLDVALAVQADGLHIGQTDMPYPLARRLMGSEAIIGLSVETVEQVLEADAYDVDYLGISPIFETPTKPELGIAWGLDGLAQVRKLSRHALVAIGGLNADNAEAVLRHGADGLAVVSAICAAPDPRRAAQELDRIFQAAYPSPEEKTP
ncbi:MAG: thiamine phosphate synthase [Chloroflexota bacterium]